MRPLNIYLVSGSAAADVPGSTIMRDNFLRTLESAGHRVVAFNFVEDVTAAEIKEAGNLREARTRGMLKRFEHYHRQRPFDLAFCGVNNVTIRPDALRKITDKVVTVNYTANYHQVELVTDVARHVTLSTYISLPAKEAFDRMGVRSFWMPMAANPDIYRPSAERLHYAAFVGTAYGQRPHLLWRLLQHGIDLHVYGPSWQPRSRIGRLARNWGEPLLYAIGDTESRLRFINRNERRLIIERMCAAYSARMHGPLSDAELVRILATSRIIINMAESRFNHDYLNPNVLRGCNFRDFEVPMAGSCLFTQYSSELEHFYEPGKEVITYYDDVDLAEKLRFYAADFPALQAIADAGHRRATANHTWQNRFDALFAHIGLS
ncbi:MAG: hypothetical protein EXR92_03835 [Gemmatimonadetes bacterium]|nr:hypothetical protein [Gemmatimonadota bacterium]